MDNNTHISYSAADIRRYLNGEMTRSEMYALEKQAAEDPMLADAIEGYSGITLEAANADLELLRSQLNGKEKQEAKVIVMKTPGGFKWWKQAIAAAVAGALILSGIYFLKGNKKEKEEVAANTQLNKTAEKQLPEYAPSSADTFRAGPDNITAVNSKAAQVPAKATFLSPDSLKVFLDSRDHYYSTTTTAASPGAAKYDFSSGDGVDDTQFKNNAKPAPGSHWSAMDSAKQSPVTTTAGELKTADFGTINPKEEARKISSPPPAPVAQAERSAPYNTQGGGVLNTNSAVQQSNEVVTNGLYNIDRGRRSSNAPQLSTAKKKAADMKDEEMVQDKAQNKMFTRSFSFSYKVVDNKGVSIPYSNIAIPADQLITYSRSDGSFGLFSADSVLRVNIKAAGYEPKTFLLRNNTQMASITLNDESFAKDKSLVIVGDQKNFALRKKGGVKAAGSEEEAEPLDGWNTYDSYLANNIDNTNKVRGDVELSFEVNKKGEIKSVTVEKSLGAKEDEEAIRLVTQGPKWKGKKKKSKGRVVVTF